MSENMDYTMKFEAVTTDEMSVSQAIDLVYDALKEKGYNPKSNNRIYSFQVIQVM